MGLVGVPAIGNLTTGSSHPDVERFAHRANMYAMQIGMRPAEWIRSGVPTVFNTELGLLVGALHRRLAFLDRVRFPLPDDPKLVSTRLLTAMYTFPTL